MKVILRGTFLPSTTVVGLSTEAFLSPLFRSWAHCAAILGQPTGQWRERSLTRICPWLRFGTVTNSSAWQACAIDSCREPVLRRVLATQSGPSDRARPAIKISRPLGYPSIARLRIGPLPRAGEPDRDTCTSLVRHHLSRTTMTPSMISGPPPSERNLRSPQAASGQGSLNSFT